jgi:hypothetical protein
MPQTTSLIGTYRRFYEDPPDEKSEGGADVWHHRTQNMICTYLKGPTGAKFVRIGNVDEAFVWALFHPVAVTAGAEARIAPAGSLVILPPGDSSIELIEGGDAWLGYTTLNTDLAAHCPNRDEYATPLDNVAPIVPWPEPTDGYCLRIYNLDDTPAGSPHCYRHRTAMTSFTWPIRTEPRNPTMLSPHAHDDFEQASLFHSGTHVHHMRRPWSRNANEWRADEHVELGAPSIAISNPADIHTTQAISDGSPVGLIDYFAPPRWDFSQIEGMVVNAAEYPMPSERPELFAVGGEVYSAGDPHAWIASRVHH